MKHASISFLGLLILVLATGFSCSTVPLDTPLPEAQAPEQEPSPVIESDEELVLPLGDGKVSTEPKVGNVFSCVTEFNGRGAWNAGDWIDADAGVWYPERKITVDGSVAWPDATFRINAEAGTRQLIGNGLPTNHETGEFPIDHASEAYTYDRNPNPIREQSVLLELHLDPELAATPRCVGMGAIGVALNGVAIYNALDAAGRDAAAHEVQDACHGHPEHDGEYHYHDFSDCVLEGAVTEPTLIGYALDGFGIYKYPGTVTNADLDECHGKIGEILWDGEATSMYHYVVTEEYPYTVGCYRGVRARP